MEPQLLALLKDNDLQQHAEVLEKAGILAVAQLSACDTNALKKAGVSVLGERKRLLMLAFDKEKKRSGAVAAPPRRSKSSSNLPAAPVLGTSLASVNDDDEPGYAAVAPIRSVRNKSQRSLAQVQFVPFNEAEKAAAVAANAAAAAERAASPPPRSPPPSKRPEAVAASPALA